MESRKLGKTRYSTSSEEGCMPAFVSVPVFAPKRPRYVPDPMKTFERVGGLGADTRTGVRLSRVWVMANQKKRSPVWFDLDIRI